MGLQGIAGARVFETHLKLKVYERGSGDVPDRVIGFTPTKKTKAVTIPKGKMWYVRPMGALNAAQLEKLAKVLKSYDVPGVDLSDHWELTNESLGALADAGGLQFLDLSRTRISDAGLGTLRRFPKLRVLLLPQGVGDAGVAHLTSHQNLEDLNLDRTALTNAGLSTLAHFQGLRRLDLSGTQITDEGLALLAKLPKLSRLILPGQTTDRAAAHLRRLTALQELDISQTSIAGEGYAAIAQLPRLETLYVNKLLTDKGLERLSVNRSLRSLDLSATGITDAGVKHLSKIKTLEELSLSQTGVGNESLKALAELPALRMLELSDTHVESTGLAPLAKLNNLSILSLSWQKLGREDLQGMAQLRQLKAIILNGVPLPETTMAQLKKLNEVSPWEPIDWIEKARRKRGGMSNQHVALASPVSVSPVGNILSGPLPERPKEGLATAHGIRTPTKVPTAAEKAAASQWIPAAPKPRVASKAVPVPASKELLSSPENPVPVAAHASRSVEKGFLSVPGRLREAKTPANRFGKAAPSAASIPDLKMEDRPVPSATRSAKREDPDVLVKTIVLQSNPSKGGAFSGLSGMRQLGKMNTKTALNDVTAASETPGITMHQDRPEDYLGEININATR